MQAAGAYQELRDCSASLPRARPPPPHPPTHPPYQILANQILRDCFDGALISNPTRAAIVGHADAGPAYIEGELKGQTWKMYMCTCEFLPASACFYPQLNLGFWS